MYDWEDKDGLGKLKRLYKMLQDSGYSPEMSPNKMFIKLFHPITKQFVVQAYASTWHSLGLIFVQIDYGVYEIGFTSSVDKAFDMVVDTYKSQTIGYPYVEKDCRYKLQFPKEKPGDGLIHCMAYSYSERKDGRHWAHHPVCCEHDCPLLDRKLLEGASLQWMKV